MKQCFKCLKTLPFDMFYSHPEMKDGKLNKCKVCTLNDSMIRHERIKNTREYKDQIKRNHESRSINAIIPEYKTCVKCKNNLPSSQFSRRRGSSDGLREYCKFCRKIETRKDYERHPERFKHNAKLRKVEQRTPKLLSLDDRRAMLNFYKDRPPGYHVDHIVPLRGINVCGLHVPWNLQYLPASDNLKKGNKL